MGAAEDAIRQRRQQAIDDDRHRAELAIDGLVAADVEVQRLAFEIRGELDRLGWPSGDISSVEMNGRSRRIATYCIRDTNCVVGSDGVAYYGCEWSDKIVPESSVIEWCYSTDPKQLRAIVARRRVESRSALMRAELEMLRAL